MPHIYLCDIKATRKLVTFFRAHIRQPLNRRKKLFRPRLGLKIPNAFHLEQRLTRKQNSIKQKKKRAYISMIQMIRIIILTES